MSKVYEALQCAQIEKKMSGGENVPAVRIPFEQRSPHSIMGEEMLGLYKMVDALLPEKKPKIIQFIGSREGEGTSTIIREFSKISADHIGNTVLLLDADRHRPTQDRFFDIEAGCSWVETLKEGDNISNSFRRIGESSLFLSPSCNTSKSTPAIFNSQTFERVFSTLRETFDLVLIDSSPLTISADGLAIASKVDGVILIVEAEKTRWQTIRQVRDSILKVGGNILGVVFNKRRYYIPQSIYKHL